MRPNLVGGIRRACGDDDGESGVGICEVEVAAAAAVFQSRTQVENFGVVGGDVAQVADVAPVRFCGGIGICRQAGGEGEGFVCAIDSNGRQNSCAADNLDGTIFGLNAVFGELDCVDEFAARSGDSAAGGAEARIAVDFFVAETSHESIIYNEMRLVNNLILLAGKPLSPIEGAVSLSLRRDIRAAGGVLTITAPPATFIEYGNLMLLPVALRDDGGSLFEGYVESVNARVRGGADGGERSLRIVCRGAPGILDDCAVPVELLETPAMMSGKTVGDVCRFICGKFGVCVAVRPGGILDEVLREDEVDPRASQTAMDYLRSLAVLRRGLLYDDGGGCLILSPSELFATVAATTILTLVDDVETGSVSADYRNRFAAVEVFADSLEGDEEESVVADDEVIAGLSPLRRGRVVIKKRLSRAEQLRVAVWDVARRAGESLEVDLELRVPYWYEPGEVLELNAPEWSLRRDMIVLRSGLEFDGDRGMRGSVLLSPPGAVVLRPQYRQREEATGSKGALSWRD